MLAGDVEACCQSFCFSLDCVSAFGVSLAFFDAEGEFEDRPRLLEFPFQLIKAFHLTSVQANQAGTVPILTPRLYISRGALPTLSATGAATIREVWTAWQRDSRNIRY